MQKLIVCQGIPSSGKSTWAKKFVLENPNYVRVNRDDLRRMRGTYWLPSQEDMITNWEDDCIAIALHNGYNVIVDATNLNKKTIDRICNLGNVKNQDIDIEYKFFDINLDEAISRDMGRAKEEQVGAKVITSMYNKYIVAKKIVEIKEDKMNQDINLPHAIICDLDGCISLANGRDIFDYNKVDTDKPNKPVVDTVKNYIENGKYGEGTKDTVIFMSGREDYCKEKTINWLENNGVWCGNIFMRKTGDFRKDCIVKKELFDSNVKGKFYIDYVLDDRSQVCIMWRSLGLTCFQVAEGNY